MTNEVQNRRLKLMAEVQCWAIWDMEGTDNIDPSALPISAGLADDINRWSDTLDESYRLSDPNFHTDLGSSTGFDVDKFYDTGWKLFARLKLEMPQTEWWYRDMRLDQLMQERSVM
jgi:hypothetical protein